MPEEPDKKDQVSQDTEKTEVSKSMPAIHPLLRVTLIFLLITLSVVILYYGKPLLMPLAIAGVLAMMLNPLMERMLKKGIPKWLTITLLSLMLVIIAAIVLFIIGRQIGVVSQGWPEIHQRLLTLLNNVERFIEKTFNINPSKQKSSITKAIPIGNFIMSFIGSLSQIISESILVLIYLILMLMERKQFRRLILNLSDQANRSNTARAIDECVNTSSKFLFGRLKIMAILIVIYCLGFWLGNVPYAFFLALIAGLLSLIPFLGNIIGGGIACILAFVTGGIVSVLIVVGVMVIGQLIGDYVLTPWILGDAVRLNPFMTIVSVVAFTILWGPIGAIIALPMVAMLRILLQNMEPTKPYATFLVGEK